MIKICHLADIHLGFRKYSKLNSSGINQREADISISFKESIQKVSQLKPNITIIAGDLFHHIRPSNAILTLAFRELRKLSAICPIILVSGNHETPKRSDMGNILKLFAEIDNVYVADSNIQEFKFDDLGLSLTAIPHMALTETMPNIQANDQYPYNVLVSHGQIGDNWISEFGGIEKQLNEISASQFDYVALGHIHVFKQVGNNAWFSGAIDHTSSNIWSESEMPKGFIEANLNKISSAVKVETKFHSLHSPREVLQLDSINASNCGDEQNLQQKIIDTLQSVSGGIEGKIVRLTIFDIPKDVYRQISYKVFKEFRAKALHLQLEFKVQVEEKNLNLANTAAHATKPLQAQLEAFTLNYKKNEAKKAKPILELYEEYFKKLEQHEAS